MFIGLQLLTSPLSTKPLGFPPERPPAISRAGCWAASPPLSRYTSSGLPPAFHFRLRHTWADKSADRSAEYATRPRCCVHAWRVHFPAKSRIQCKLRSRFDSTVITLISRIGTQISEYKEREVRNLTSGQGDSCASGLDTSIL